MGFKFKNLAKIKRRGKGTKRKSNKLTKRLAESVANDDLQKEYGDELIKEEDLEVKTTNTDD